MYDFSKKYERKYFYSFLERFLPEDFVKKELEYKDLPKSSFIKKVVKLGEIDSLNNLLVFEVKHDSANDPRITLTKQIFTILNSLTVNKALVVFYSQESDQYRFSYIEGFLEWETDTRISKKFSKPKRFSFLLGKDAKLYTPHNQLKKRVDSLSDLKSRFNIEVVTDEFYDNYKKLYLGLYQYLSKDKNFIKFSNKVGLNINVFAKKLLGQIVFCYFIQKKNWLGAGKNKNLDNGDKNFLRNRFIQINNDKKNYFNDFLEYLFYAGFNNDKSNHYLNKLECKVPYLNGGLFEEIDGYEWINEELDIPNKIFSNSKGNGILDIFDLYNFTVDEYGSFDVDIAIDPEMLGNVFEKLLEENLRAEKGAYYTPRGIVSYMCKNSVINYLSNSIKNIDKKALVNFISIASNFSRVEILNEEEKNTLNLLRPHLFQIDSKLENIKICDPAVGSGAFPVSMMNEIVNLRKLISEINNTNLSKYSLKKYFIKNCIYGVDIEPSAVEIAKLRLWLSLVVDLDDYNKIEPLPNLDYKIMQGDSLINEYYGISFEPKNEGELFSINDELQSILKQLNKKQQEYHNLVYQKVKIEKRKEVNNLLKKALGFALDQLASANKLHSKKKRTREINIKKIKENILNLSNTYFIKDFFFWKLFFSDVFLQKNGFDIIIVNPPYVFTRDVEWPDEFKKYVFKNYLNFESSDRSLKVQTGKINLFILFILQSSYLMNDNGVACFITPNGLLRSIAYQDTRKHILKTSQFIEIADLGSGAFGKNITVSPIVFLFRKALQGNLENFDVVEANFAKDKVIKRKKVQEMNQSTFLDNVSYVISIKTSKEELKISSKIHNDKFYLENICKEIIPGIEADKELIKNSKKNNNYKKLLLGRNIHPYHIDFDDNYLEYKREQLRRARPDYIWKLDKKVIVRRISGGKSPLICSLDQNKFLSFNSTNLIVLSDDLKKDYSYEFIVLLINSKLMNFYYAKNFSNESDLTVNIATTFLDKLPLKKITNKNKKNIKEISLFYNKICGLSLNLFSKNNSSELEKFNNLKNVIDDKIYDFYELTKDDKNMINFYFK